MNTILYREKRTVHYLSYVPCSTIQLDHDNVNLHMYFLMQNYEFCVLKSHVDYWKDILLVVANTANTQKISRSVFHILLEEDTKSHNTVGGKI